MMNFGVSVGELLQGIDVCRKLRRSFASAPRQFQQIADQVRSLSIVLQDIEISASNHDLTDAQSQDLQHIAHGCHDVLLELSELVEKSWLLDKNVEGARNRAKRVWARVNWSPEIVLSFEGRISANAALLNVFHARIARTATANLLRHAEDQEYQKTLEWLSPTQYSLEHSDLISRRHPGTGRWLLDSPEFRRWLETPSAIMFCPGIPGAGKTILAASVIDHLLSSAQTEDGIGIAYIYLNFRRQDDQTLVHLLASLVKHFAQQDACAAEALKSLYKTHNVYKTRPSTNELDVLLNTIVSLPSFKRIFIIVDALDECPTAENCRANFISVLSNLSQTGKANVFTTSRPSPEIQNAFKQSSTIALDVRASDEDVQAYLEGNLDKLPNCIRVNSTLQDQIKVTIAKAADGMFLLARIYLSQLDDKLTPKAVKTALSHFEEQREKSGASEEAKLKVLSQAYDQTMERIYMQKSGFRLIAENALLWIVSGRRPLVVMEFLQALGIDEKESVFDDDNIPQLEDVISACAGLVVVDKESHVVRLVHYTTQEYFKQRQRQPQPQPQDAWLRDAEWCMARACITYLFTWGNREWQDIDGSVPAHTLFDYAATHWGHHLALAPAQYQLSSEVMDFVKSAKHLDRCRRVLPWGLNFFEQIEFELSGRNALHFAAHFGLMELIKALLDDREGRRDHAANVGDRHGRTPIFYAVCSGKDDALKELVSRGATVLHKVSKDRYRTPLEVAACFGQAKLVKFLVGHGANVNDLLLPPSYRQEIRELPTTVLSEAALLGHAETVEALLACGADVEFENKAGEAAIFLAAGKGHAEVVQLLLSNGAHVDSSNRELTTPLINACQGHHLGVVELLLRNGADFETTDMRGMTALRAAARSGVEAIVLALINAGARIDAREMRLDTLDTPVPTPLLLACEAGHARVARQLLARGAHVEAYRRFIHLYARHCDPKMSDLTPLLVAAYKGHAAVVAALLEYGADTEAATAEWQTPLMLAARKDRYDVVRLLLDAGADVHGVDAGGRNAATVVWNAHGRTERDLKSRDKENVAKQREILQIFASKKAKLITEEWEGEDCEVDWDGLNKPRPSGFRTIESDLRVDMF